MARKPPKHAIEPVGQQQSARETGFWKTEQNEDGSTRGRQGVSHYFAGLDVTPTISVAAEFDEIVRLIAHGFDEGTVAVLQAVQGDNSGTRFSDVVVEGIPVALTHEHTVITLPFSGRFRLLFRNGWAASPDARISELRQERIPDWGSLSGGVLIWESTGELQCRPEGDDPGLYEQEVNQHGRTRWVKIADDCGWESANEFQCRDDGLYEREVNRAGDLRWVKVANDCGWTGTGELQCRDDGLYERERNKAGDYRWALIAADCGWESDDTLQCRDDGLYSREVNRVGETRWVKVDDDCGWETTGELQCRLVDYEGDTYNLLFAQERNRAGDERWVTDDEPCTAVPTGRTSCAMVGEVPRIHKEMVDTAGRVFWEATFQTCYDPTYSLPCGGWAFGPGDSKDPAATVELTDCHDGAGADLWIYPNPIAGMATVPVGDCHDICLIPDDIVGYAANHTRTGVVNRCTSAGGGDCCSRLDVAAVPGPDGTSPQ